MAIGIFIVIQISFLSIPSPPSVKGARACESAFLCDASCCCVYCMVFLMRGFLEGLFSVAPFESDVDLSGDGGTNTFDKTL